MRDARPELVVALRTLEEVDDLHQLALGLLDPRDVVERHASELLGFTRRAVDLPKLPMMPPPCEERRIIQTEKPTMSSHGTMPSRRFSPERPPGVLCLGVHHDVLACDQLRQLRAIDEGRHLRLEAGDVDGLGLARAGHSAPALEVTVDGVLGELIDSTLPARSCSTKNG